MPSPRELWITDAILCTQDDSRRVRRGHIHVVDGEIAAIRASLPARTRGRRLSARGLHVFPGFVQTHVHLCQTLFRGQADELELMDWLREKIWKFEAAHTRKSLHTSALVGIRELLASGTTCILDMGTVRHTEAILEAVAQTGIRANVGKCLMDDPLGTPTNLREERAAAMREALALHARWNGARGGRIRVSFAPRFALSCTRELLEDVARHSKQLGALIHTHACESREEIALVRKRTGRENLRYLRERGVLNERAVIAHGVWLSPAERKLLKASRASLTHCPSSNLKLASGIAPVPELLRMGINVSLGADGAPCNNRLDAFQEMRLAALIHKPGGGPRTLPAQTALDMATRNGARALHWQEQIGSIELGKRADLVGVDLLGGFPLLPPQDALNPSKIASALVYSASPADLRWTLVEGRPLYRQPARPLWGKLQAEAAKHHP